MGADRRRRAPPPHDARAPRARHRRPSVPGSRSCSRDPRDRPGDDRDDLPRRRRAAPRARAAATASSRSTSRGRAGSSTTRRRSTRACSRRPRRRSRTRASRRPTLARDRDREPARDHRPLGAGERNGRSRPRSSGRTGAPPRAAASSRPSSSASARASSRTRTSRRRSSSGCSRAPTGRPEDLAFGTVDAWLAWRLAGRARHRPDERVAHAPLRARGGGVGRRAARALRRPARRAPARRRLGRGRRRGRAARRAAAARRARGRPAGGARRARLLRTRRGEGDVRHRQLRARPRRSDVREPPPLGLARDGRCARAATRSRARC